jgi:short-subunit dehydrogenase
MSSKRSDRQTVLITGASRGIGYELAKIFARSGHDLILVGKDERRLRAVSVELGREYHIPVQAIAVDLSLIGAAEQIIEEIRGYSLKVDILINNAGFGAFGPFENNIAAQESAMIRVNMAALTELTKLILKDMRSRGSGRILNVASTAAFQPGPLMAVYYASKAYVLSFSEALADELRGSGVTVGVLCPGPTRTDFQRSAEMKPSKLSDWLTLEASTVAAAGYRGLMKNKTVIIPGFANKLLAFSVRLVPRRWAAGIVRRMHEASLPGNASESVVN